MLLLNNISLFFLENNNSSAITFITLPTKPILTMGIKQNIDPDLMIGIAFGGYMKAILAEHGRIAIHCVELMNAVQTPQFQITDLPKFELDRTVDSQTYGNDYAMEWCYAHAVDVVRAMSLERNTLFTGYKEMG